MPIYSLIPVIQAKLFKEYLEIFEKLVDEDDFYSGDGCYTFEVEIVNVLGGTYVDSSSMIQFFWDENESDEDTTNDQPAESC